MRPLGIAAIGTIVLAIVEIVLFVLLSAWIGWGWALLLAFATTILGAVLLKREGVRGWRRFRAAVDERRPPGAEAGDGLVGLLAAVLLLVPGFLSDAVGLVLLVPPVRALTRRRVRTWTERRISAAAAGDLFGPRFVRATRSTPPAAEPGEPPQQHRPPAVEGEVVEGEIIDPRAQ